jgi:hypothetical protein
MNRNDCEIVLIEANDLINMSKCKRRGQFFYIHPNHINDSRIMNGLDYEAKVLLIFQISTIVVEDLV